LALQIRDMDSLVLVKNLIYEIRGQKVMLDFELAELYEVETKYLNRATKNSAEVCGVLGVL
jgi:hypothetical protein